MSEWGDRVQARRKSLSMRQAELARRVGVSAASVNDWESGKTQSISGVNLLRLAEALALASILVGLVALLRSVWLAVVTELGLLAGIGWTFGWATVSVGELNLLSMVFLLALIGIGVDYLIQVVSRYRHEAAKRPPSRALWVRVFRAIAPMSGALFSGCEEGDAPIAMLGFHGTTHTVVDIAQGVRARDVIIERNGCQPEEAALEADGCLAFQGCSEGHSVTWCEFDGGHMPAPQSAPRIWDFFSQF